MECKELAKVIAGDQWNVGATKDVNMEHLWTWEKVDGVDASEGVYLGADR